MNGAVDFEECPSRGHRCQCGKCGVCGFQKHTAIHGPYLNKPPGSKPVGHEFTPIGKYGNCHNDECYCRKQTPRAARADSNELSTEK